MLGFYRENNFIEWDDDADIGLDMRYRKNIYPVIEEAKALGFFVPPEALKDTIVLPTLCPYYDTVFIKGGEKIEGWWYDRKVNDTAYYIYDQFRCGNVLKHDAKYYDEIQTMKFRGEDFPVPNHVENWLEMMYGVDWRIPNPKKKYNSQA
jgi:phosphorylcholine metabolism protein LicD